MLAALPSDSPWDTNPEVQRAAVRVSLEHFLADPQTEPLVKTAFAHLDPSATGVLLEEVAVAGALLSTLGILMIAGQTQKLSIIQTLLLLVIPKMARSCPLGAATA